jgi:hypothetical protein
MAVHHKQGQNKSRPKSHGRAKEERKNEKQATDTTLLQYLPLVDVLLDRVGAQQTIYVHVLFAANAPGSILIR